MNGRIRVWFGVALIGAGITVAIVGYLGVSAETEVAFQLPYFASAAVGSLLLLGLGGAMLVSAQLERDTERIEDVVEAVRALSAEVARLSDELIERRGRARMRVVAQDDRDDRDDRDDGDDGDDPRSRHPANGKRVRVRRAN